VKKFGAFVVIPWLKRLYEEHLNRETKLENGVGREEERNNRM